MIVANPREHLKNLRRRQPEVSVSAILCGCQQSCFDEFREMEAGRLRSDTGSAGKFDGGQCATIQ
jgi:hypothetical protein